MKWLLYLLGTALLLSFLFSESYSQVPAAEEAEAVFAVQ